MIDGNNLDLKAPPQGALNVPLKFGAKPPLSRDVKTVSTHVLKVGKSVRRIFPVLSIIGGRHL